MSITSDDSLFAHGCVLAKAGCFSTKGNIARECIYHFNIKNLSPILSFQELKVFHALQAYFGNVH